MGSDIESQDEALAELREAHAEEENERLRLESAMYHARNAIEEALQAVNHPLCPPVELARDMAGHINLMAHGDPDYLLKNGMSVRHVDLREGPPQEESNSMKITETETSTARGAPLHRATAYSL